MTVEDWSEDDFKEEEIKININTELLKSIAKDVFLGTESKKAGPLLGLKIALQVLEDAIYVISYDAIDVEINENVLYVDKNAIDYALGVSKCTERKVVCITGHKDLLNNIGKITMCDRDIIYICLHDSEKLENVAEMITDKYAATASIAYPEDYINKLRKVGKGRGFRFIEVFTANYEKWGFDVSDTVHVADMAVKTKIWPLIEKQKRVKVTKIPDYFEPVERFYELIQMSLDEEERQKIQKKVDKKWKKLVF